MMEIHDRSNSEINDINELFEQSILDSPWVLFHGTTNVSSELIDENGFEFSNSYYTKDDVLQVISIFQKMDWHGLGFDSYGALYSYALNVDFQFGDSKPVFFTDKVEKTIGYTKKHRAGGETAGCLYNAILDLQAFLKDEQVRKDFRRLRYNTVLNSVKGIKIPEKFSSIHPDQATAANCLELAKYLNKFCGRKVVFNQILSNHTKKNSYDPWDEDLDWLSRQLNQLDELLSRLQALSNHYSHGVIYAVEFCHADLSYLKNLNTGAHHGFGYYKKIPVDRIVAKTLISGSQPKIYISPYSNQGEINRLKDGVTGALMDPKDREEAIIKFSSALL